MYRSPFETPHRPLARALLIGAVLTLGAAGAGADTEDANTDPGVGQGGTDASSAPGEVTLFGLIRLRRPDMDGDRDDGNAFGAFVRFEQAAPVETLLAGFRPDADTCTLETDGDSDDDDFLPNITGRPFQFVGAGETLVFDGPDGPFLTLPFTEQPDFAGYKPDSRPLPAPFPSNAGVDITGDVFPAFASVPVVDVDSLVVSAPADDDDIPLDTTFRWEAGTSDGTRVEIELEIDDANDGDDIEVKCSATDDGEFVLPADVMDRLPGNALADVDMNRVGHTVRDGAGALLVIEHEATGGR